MPANVQINSLTNKLDKKSAHHERGIAQHAVATVCMAECMPAWVQSHKNAGMTMEDVVKYMMVRMDADQEFMEDTNDLLAAIVNGDVATKQKLSQMACTGFSESMSISRPHRHSAVFAHALRCVYCPAQQ